MSPYQCKLLQTLSEADMKLYVLYVCDVGKKTENDLNSFSYVKRIWLIIRN